MKLLQVRVLLGFIWLALLYFIIMRNLFFKTTHPRHPSRLLRFVYSFLRLRSQAVFFVRPRSRNSLFFRLQILRKLFVWFYSDRFNREGAFQKLIRRRTTNFRSFLDFCTTLETTVPVLLYRLHFVENIENGFVAVRAGCVFRNGVQVRNPLIPVGLGDFIELFFDTELRVFSLIHLVRCLPTLRVRLTLKDSIVNTELFYSQFLRHYTLLAVFARTSVSGQGLFNTNDLDRAVVFNIYRFFSQPLMRLVIARTQQASASTSLSLSGFWWNTANCRLLLARATLPLLMEKDDNYQRRWTNFNSFTRDILSLPWSLPV